MNRILSRFAILVIFTAALPIVSAAQGSTGNAILWERVNIRSRDLYNGPGGAAMRPNTRRIRFLRDEQGGNNRKYRIRDASGREWVAKIADESQPEAVAVRLLWGLGYKTEIDYLVPRLTIPGKGTFTNVRLEARPENVDRQGRWAWESNPFVGTPQLQGLKIMMAFLNNWDLKDSNTAILRRGSQRHYVISDLGSSLGKTSGNSLFFLTRFGRSVNNPAHYSNSDFLKGVKDGELDFAYQGEQRDLLDGITVRQGRWLADLLRQLSDRQINDALRAANYRPAERRILARAIRQRITELDRVTRGIRAAG